MAASSTRVSSGVAMSRMAAAYTLRTRGEQLADTAAVPGRDEVQRREGGELQALLDLLADQIALLGGNVVPLVDGEHQGASLLDHRAEQACVLFGDAVVRVHHGDHHVRRLDGLQRLDDAEFLDRRPRRARGA